MNPSLLCFQFSHRRRKFQRARCLPPAPIRADRCRFEFALYSRLWKKKKVQAWR
ncbi:hypothetical protein ES319_D08G118200v1 [Gossypium barbadense]|uniref:Uncharacterized protein n=3 Tax=Gossypium TaxID=3633 RepID=A0A5J5QJ10_GOSBA|nr:hypothetical protein ES319_D08G118200v1 [Gossypium barbadense]TYG57216.1 hypothetical protein ES288_D08G125200v1 [Gossypium darwinii]TYH58037.1 hypothetical protein ES332_D08G128700v1 [Gossypium tomentosum]